MKRYTAHCDACGFHKVINDDPRNFDLIKGDSIKVQGRLPRYDLKKKKFDTFSEVERMPKYKCPDCGRMISTKRYLVPEQKNHDEQDPST